MQSLQSVTIALGLVAPAMSQTSYPVPDDASFFCFKVSDYYKQTPAACLQAPDQCIPVVQGLSDGFIKFGSQTCFKGPGSANQDMWQRQPPLPLVPRDQGSAQYILATDLFSASTPAIDPNYFVFEAEVSPNEIIGCIEHNFLFSAMTELSKPVVTYQMLANALPIFSSSDPAVIAKIQMFVSSSNPVTDFTSAYNTTPAGMFTQPSSLTFVTESFMTINGNNISYNIPGVSRQHDSASQLFPFKPGAFKSTAVINGGVNNMGQCQSVLNVPISKVFRKMGVNDAIRNQPIQPGQWFNVSECKTTLNNCDDISLLAMKCTQTCPPMHKVATPCSFFQDTKCIPVTTAPPTNRPKQLSSADSADNVPVIVSFAVVAFVLLIVAGVTVQRRKNRGNPEDKKGGEKHKAKHTPHGRHHYKSNSNPFNSGK